MKLKTRFNVNDLITLGLLSIIWLLLTPSIFLATANFLFSYGSDHPEVWQANLHTQTMLSLSGLAAFITQKPIVSGIVLFITSGLVCLLPIAIIGLFSVFLEREK